MLEKNADLGECLFNIYIYTVRYTCYELGGLYFIIWVYTLSLGLGDKMGLTFRVTF